MMVTARLSKAGRPQRETSEEGQGNKGRDTEDGGETSKGVIVAGCLK
jgi:hypothetical protein